MCTVVFIPKGNKYFFASLRDENPLRPGATTPDFKLMENTNVLSPTDALAGGTWLGITETGNIIILLNGVFEKHDQKINNTKSRGLIVSKLLTANSPIAAWDLFELETVAPFTLVAWSKGDLYELVWDGKIKHITKLKPTVSYIWSSSTLYNGAAKIDRKKRFQEWIKTNIPVSAVSLFKFFESYCDDENGFLMNRNEQIKTLSYSFIEMQLNRSANMLYHDFLNDSYSHKTIEFGKYFNSDNLSTGLLESVHQDMVNSLGLL